MSQTSCFPPPMGNKNSEPLLTTSPKHQDGASQLNHTEESTPDVSVAEDNSEESTTGGAPSQPQSLRSFLSVNTNSNQLPVPSTPPPAAAKTWKTAALVDADNNNTPHIPRSAKHLLCRNTSSGSNLSEAGKSVTYAAQGRLPRLPIPSLEQTMAKLPKVLEALQNDKQRAETARVIKEFVEGPGPILQQALVDYEKEKVESGEIGSYVEEFWNDSYLSPDASVVLNLNPFFVLEDGPDPKIAKDQLKRAASLCFASIKLASVLKIENLPPDTFKGRPLCMDQFKVLFGSSRQPSMDSSDDVHVYSDSSHVVVLCNNQFYYFPVLWPVSGHVAVDEGDIHEILQAIKKHAMNTDPTEACKEALGVFTGLPRSEWAKAREDIAASSEANRMALNVIDSALFVLVLDNYEPKTVHEAAANMLHGTNQLAAHETAQIGTSVNRWYDKLQIIVCKDGSCGINFEHSTIDGHTALRFVSDVFAETVISFAESIVDVIHGRGRIQHVVNAEIERAVEVAKDVGRTVLDVYPKKLVFDFSASIKEQIYFAETALCDEIDASDTYVLEFKDYGKHFLVSNKLSPDSFVQMSILLAYYKLYGKVVCMYEPVLTKTFYHGRTEAMRSATPQAKELCRIWCDKKSTPAAKLHAIRVATTEHSRLVKESAKGYGVDRHLFSLKCIAQRNGIPIPAFFESDAWKTLNHTVLSTSNCGNPALRLFGFGPVVPNGFGVGYIIKDHGLSYSVSSKHRQTKRYVRSLRTTLKELQDVLLPVSSIEVKNRRTTLVEVKHKLRRYSSTPMEYPDVYGESTAPEVKPPSPKQTPRMLIRKNSKPFATAVERHNSIDFLSYPEIRIVNVELQPTSENNNMHQSSSSHHHRSSGLWYFGDDFDDDELNED